MKIMIFVIVLVKIIQMPQVKFEVWTKIPPKFNIADCDIWKVFLFELKLQ